MRFRKFYLGVLISVLVIEGAAGLLAVTGQQSNTPVLYREQFRLEEGAVRYYVTSLKVNDTWTLNCTGIYEGIFYLFIFHSRPKEGYIDPTTKQISDQPYADAMVYNNTPVMINASIDPTRMVSFITLNYTSTENRLHYLGIFIVANPPDTFILYSNQQLQPYFIPFIDGYPQIWVVLLGLTGLGLLVRRMQKRIKMI